MALPNTNISTTLVGDLVGSLLRNVSGLCIHANVNKWSKKKPTSMVGFPTEWYKASDNFYGLDPVNDWAYIKPSGGPSSPYRLGDFRGYEHDQALTMPPSYVLKSGTSFAATTVYDPRYEFIIDGQLSVNTGQISEITLTDMGLQGYYFGIYVRQASHGIFGFKTLGVVAENGQWISGSVNMVPPYDAFNDFPDVIYGDDVDVSFILSSDIISDWSGTPPTTFYYLPNEFVNGLEIKSDYVMTIGNFLFADTSAWVTFEDVLGSAVRQTAQVTTNITALTYPAGWKLISKPTWLDITYARDVGSTKLPPLYDTDMLRADVNETNTGPIRHGTIILGDDEGDLESITVSQKPGPIDVYVQSSQFSLTDDGCSGTVNESVVDVSFTTFGSDLPDKEKVWWYVVINGITVYSSLIDEFFLITPQNSSVNQIDVNIDYTLQGGENVFINLVTGGPYMPL